MEQSRREMGTLGEALKGLTSRLRRVDFDLLPRVIEIWPDVVTPIIAERCRPVLIKDGLLVIHVPSGAFAERIRADEGVIVEALSQLGDGAPRGVRTVVN